LQHIKDRHGRNKLARRRPSHTHSTLKYYLTAVNQSTNITKLISLLHKLHFSTTDSHDKVQRNTRNNLGKNTRRVQNIEDK